MVTPDEKNLLAQSQAGNAEAFNTLLDLHRNSVINHMRAKYKASYEDIEDFVQAASIKAWQKLSSFRGESSFMTWFCLIVRNEFLNHIKKPNVKFANSHFSIQDNKNNFKGSDDLLFLSYLAKEPQVHETALTLIEKHEQLIHYKQVLEDTLAKLSPNHREILSLVVEQQLSYEEAADKLKIPVGTVMSRLFFAKKQAKQILKQYATFNELQSANLG